MGMDMNQSPDKSDSIFYFQYRITPKPEHTELIETGGTCVSCWLRRNSKPEARENARTYIKSQGWNIISLDESSQVERWAYKENPELLEFFEQAQQTGECYMFHYWPLGAKDRLKNIKLQKEKNSEGKVESYTVTVSRKGYFVKQRFKDMKSSFDFIKSVTQDDDSLYDRKQTGAHSRKHNRIRSLNIVSYTCYDKNANIVAHGMGRSLNVSQGGILLETYIPVETQYDIALCLDTEVGLLMDIKAQTVFCKACGKGKFECGIKFLETNELTDKVVEKYLRKLKGQISDNFE